MSKNGSIEERQRQVVEEFSFFDDWMGRYEHLIDQASSLPLIPDELKDEDHLIRGCQSQVWVNAELEDGVVRYTGDSDAQITKGLVALLIRVLSGHPPEVIATTDLTFLDEIGLQEHLSPTRKNGLAGMIRQMKLHAVQFAAQN